MLSGPLNPFGLFPFRVDISEDGMKALITLSSGDMRRALNILQVWHHSKQISSCFGKFSKKDISNSTTELVKSLILLYIKDVSPPLCFN